jgi:hypothetical protein
MKILYEKPKTLSDPFFDWQDSEAEISKVLATNPQALDHDAFSIIFYENLPAANYQEGCFFVPYFLDFYEATPNFRTPNLTGFFWFIDYFRHDFERDGLIDPIFARIWEIFLNRTLTFTIYRLSDEELMQYSISDSYREMASGSPLIHELLDCFTKWAVFDSVLDRLQSHFEQASQPERSFWFCECAFHTRNWLWVDSEPLVRRQALFNFFHTIERFRFHYHNSFLNFKCELHKSFTQYNRRIAPN